MYNGKFWPINTTEKQRSLTYMFKTPSYFENGINANKIKCKYVVNQPIIIIYYYSLI